MVRWRDERDDECERDWWEEDEEEEGYSGYDYGDFPYGSTIMGIPYPLAIDIMRGKWPPRHEDGGLFNRDSACGDAGDLFSDPFGGGDFFEDPSGSGGDFFDGGMDL